MCSRIHRIVAPPSGRTRCATSSSRTSSIMRHSSACAAASRHTGSSRDTGIHDGPLFRRIRRGDHVEASAITSRAARSIIQARAADAGIDGRVSGHSLRIGAAQSLAAAGAGLVELQQAGRWDSPSMPAHYARGQLAAHGAVARLRHSKGKLRLPTICVF